MHQRQSRIEEIAQLEPMAGNQPRQLEDTRQGTRSRSTTHPRGKKSDPPVTAQAAADSTDAQLRPARHSYSVGAIDLFLQMVLSAPTSIRAAASVLKLIARHLPFVNQAPCANSGRLWLLRVGLFQLNCPKKKADDWVWMMDHTLQLGPYKCLVIVGIRLSAWEADRPLTHQDMTLLNLTPMEQSSGERVHEQLLATVEKTGVPLAVVSDEGSDLKRGMEFFRRDHPTVRHQHDMKHKNALLLKKELTNDPRWGEFVTQANLTKLGTTQTALAFLNPPGMKSKARYMNLDTLVRWGERTLEYLDASGAAADSSLDRGKLKEKLGWLRSYRPALKRWLELLAVARAAERIVQGGVHSSVCDDLRAEFESLATTPAARRMSGDVLAFQAAESAGMSVGERLIGSTEVLESIIGKYKRVQSSHSKGGMTAMLLSIGAMVGKRSLSGIGAALENVRSADIDAWCREHLGVTIQSQRRRLQSATKTG